MGQSFLASEGTMIAKRDASENWVWNTVLLTVKQVATMLSVSQRHVYELMNPRNKAGDLREDPLPFYRLGKSVRFEMSEVQAWLSSHKSSHNPVSRSAIPSNSAPVNQL